MTDQKEDSHDRKLALILSLATVVLAGFTLVVLSYHKVPDENEILFGTVVGFLFGNMVGPVFRKIFGGMDTETRKTQVAQGEALKEAVTSLATSTPVSTDQPQEVKVVNEKSDPVPVSDGPASPPTKEEAVY